MIVGVLRAIVLAAASACSSPAPAGLLHDTAPPDAEDQRCVYETFVNDDCDKCQNEACCDERFACYDDKDCYWADFQFDKCEEGDAGGDGDCWNEFQHGGGKLSENLYACIAKNCAKECQTP